MQSSWDMEDPQKTRDWAPQEQNTGNRGVMLRLMANDAPTMAKSTDIDYNNLTMETILGYNVKR